MKVSKKNVTEAIANCKKSIINETVSLIGKVVQEGEVINLGKNIVIYENEKGAIKPFVFDRISYNQYWYFIEDVYGNMRSSLFLSVDQLKVVYEAVYEVVRKK